MVGDNLDLYYFRVTMEHNIGQTFLDFVAMSAQERRNWHFARNRKISSLSPGEETLDIYDRLPMKRSHLLIQAVPTTLKENVRQKFA